MPRPTTAAAAPAPAPEPLTQIKFQVDPQLARRIKTAAAQDGETIRAILTLAAEEWLARRAVARR